MIGSSYRYWLLGVLMVGVLETARAGSLYGCDRPIRLAWLANAIVYRDGKGLDPDLIAELQKRSGCVFEGRQMTRDAAWQGFADGSLDMATNGIPSPEQRQQTFFIPMFFYRSKLIVPTAIALGIDSFADFISIPDAQFGMLRGQRHGAYFDGSIHMLRVQKRVREYGNDVERFAALQRGEISGLLAHDINLSLMLPEREQRKFRVLDVNPGPSLSVGLLLSRGTFNPAQVAEWLRLLEAMRVDGTLTGLVETNIPGHLTEEFLHSGYHYDVSKRNGTP